MDATISDPLVGRVLDDRYEIHSRIARGGMATVYLALDRRLERDVALKVLHHHLADDVEFTVRFVREARSAARLSHPNVVQVYDQGEDDGLLYLAMEYLPGRTLRDVIAERGVLTPRETLTVAESVLDALAAAHRAGIVHRDVKPENVVLTDEGRIKVADFGLARAASASTATSSMLLGTVAYLSPELVGRGVADARSDVYAVGVMLFEMLTGRQPFTGEVPIQVAYRHVHEDVPPPSRLVPDLPAELDDLVLAAAARDPDHRPADAGALLTMVRQAHAALTDAELDARPPRPPASAAPATPAVGITRGKNTRRPPADPTQVVALDGERQRTQALPGLARGPRQHAVPMLRPLDRSDDDPFGRQVGRSRDEDAELALLAQRRRRRGLIGLLLVLALALGAAGYTWFIAFGPGSRTTMPRVVGLTQADAEKLVRARGLVPVVEQRFDDTARAGDVVDSDPGAGIRVANDTNAKLYISKGPQMVTVPPVKGKSQDDARTSVEAAQLKLGDVTQVYDDTAPQGTVIDSDPAEGRTVKHDSTVSITVSKGPKPVDLPDLTHQTQDAAVSTLSSLGLGNHLTQDYSDTVPRGQVISQDPGAGPQPRGTTVNLVISQGPRLVQLPNVVGQQYKDAKRALEALGLQVQEQRILGGFFGTVRSQNPQPGQVPAGSLVVLSVV